MIHNLVSSIGFRLDEFIKNKLSITEDTVVISSLVDINGNMNQEIENKITIFLINIEEEKITKTAISVLSGYGSTCNCKCIFNVFSLFSKF